MKNKRIILCVKKAILKQFELSVYLETLLSKIFVLIANSEAMSFAVVSTKSKAVLLENPIKQGKKDYKL